MPSQIVIIGAGPAGEAAASTLCRLDKNATVTLVEKSQVGGLCLNRGCIPSKTLLEQVRKIVDAKKTISWIDVQAVKSSVVSSIRTQLEVRLKKEGVRTLQGSAQFTGPNSLEVKSSFESHSLTFDKAILATGTDIYFPAALEPHKANLLTSDSILEINQTPKSVLIVGGGAVGCEFACLLNAAGSQVTLLEMKDQLLPGEDAAVAQILAQSFEKRGIRVITGAVAESLIKSGSGWSTKLSNGEVLISEQVLACVGRTPNVQGLGLAKAGIMTDKNKVVVNAQLQTSNPNIYAAGDIAGTRLAHHAAAQGETAALNVLGGQHTTDDRFVPRCLYSWPEVASVGSWKYQLEEQGKPVKTARAFFKGSSKALASGETDGFVQIVSDPDSKKILGAQIIGPHATELIHLFSVALKAEMTTQDLNAVMFAHPTLSEVVKDAARK